MIFTEGNTVQNKKTNKKKKRWIIPTLDGIVIIKMITRHGQNEPKTVTAYKFHKLFMNL